MAVSLWAVVATVNIAVYGWMALATGHADFTAREALAFGADFGPLTLGEGEWWRLLTATYLHAGPFHLLMNMLCLWAWGRFVERRAGGARFLLAYTLCGLAASLASVILNPDTVSLGASGAILGMLGFMAGMRLKGDAGVPLNVILINAFYSIPLAMFVPQVDWIAHAAGFLAGIAAALALAPPPEPEPAPAPPPPGEERAARGPWG